MTAMDYWNTRVTNAQQERQYGQLPDANHYDSMNSWTVAMFNLAMKFAEDYATKRINDEYKQAIAQGQFQNANITTLPQREQETIR